MIVVDASIVTKAALPLEADYEKAMQLLDNHTFGIEEIIVPDFLFYEVANALTTKSAIPLKSALKLISSIYELKFNIYSLNEADVVQAIKLAKKYKTSVYDMLYAVVAKKHNIDLITADEKFVNQVNLSFIKLL